MEDLGHPTTTICWVLAARSTSRVSACMTHPLVLRDAPSTVLFAWFWMTLIPFCCVGNKATSTGVLLSTKARTAYT